MIQVPYEKESPGSWGGIVGKMMLAIVGLTVASIAGAAFFTMTRSGGDVVSESVNDGICCAKALKQNSVEAWQDYLVKFPSGNCADVAKKHLADLLKKRNKAKPADKAEETEGPMSMLSKAAAGGGGAPSPPTGALVPPMALDTAPAPPAVDETSDRQAADSAEETTTGGALSKGVIRKVLKKNQRRFQACYERVLRRNPRLKGVITVKITINRRGRVTSAEVKKDTMNNPKVNKCVLKSLKRVRFPRPSDGNDVTVTYPFKFRP